MQEEYLEAPEYLIKAAYLYKFIFFIEWPDADRQSLKTEDNKTITIGILGRDPFGTHFKDIEGRLVKSINKRVITRRLGPFTNGMDLKQCQILFISDSEKHNMKMILESTGSAAVLTVSDTKDFLSQGGMINLVNIKGSIRWKINLDPIKRAKLKVSSTLLQSAVDVVPAP